MFVSTLRVCFLFASFVVRSYSSSSQTDIQAITFLLPTAVFKSEKERRFFVSATDGRVTKVTALAQINGQSASLDWNETLNGL